MRAKERITGPKKRREEKKERKKTDKRDHRLVETTVIGRVLLAGYCVCVERGLKTSFIDSTKKDSATENQKRRTREREIAASAAAAFVQPTTPQPASPLVSSNEASH